MYLNHWQLDRKPFEPAPEGEALFRTQSYQEACCKLRYVLENPRAAGVLTGPGGVGKTLLVESLISQLPATIAPVIRVVYPQMTPRELLSFLATRLSGETSDNQASWSVDRSWQVLETTLASFPNREQRPLVVVDEAHLLEDSGLLETVRLLLNLHQGGEPLVTFLLLGQPSLAASLARNPRLEERLDIAAILEPFTPEETAEYVDHRLTVAGAPGHLFSSDGCDALHYHAAGIPRRINRLADLALVIGFAQHASRIDAPLVEAVANELSPTRAA